MKQLLKISKTLRELGLNDRADSIDKIASKAGAKAAKGLNWNVAEQQLSEEGSGSDMISREEVRKRVSVSPAFSDDALLHIEDIKLNEDFSKRLNKKEKIFLELGSFTNKDIDISLIIDYLKGSEDVKVEKPGDLFAALQFDISNLQSITEKMAELDMSQRLWHEELRNKNLESGSEYLTDEVVYAFEDGWKVVYVPAVGEGPYYKGDKTKSNDRTVEGNICGLCLGESSGMYQTNQSGKIYSVRDPRNRPKVTIRIRGTGLEEAKGKNNLPPEVEAASKAISFFEHLEKSEGLSYKNNYDYSKFPPTTIEQAESSFLSSSAMTERDFTGRYQVVRQGVDLWRLGWVASWYKNGSKIIDDEVEQAIADNDIMVLKSGLPKKYKELCYKVAEFYANKYVTEKPLYQYDLFGGESEQDFEHETWKVYRKETWMQNAVKTLSDKNVDKVISLGMHMIPEFKDFIEEDLHISVQNGKFDSHYKIEQFHKAQLGEVFPKVEKQMITRVIEVDTKLYFTTNMNSSHPEHLALASRRLVLAIQDRIGDSNEQERIMRDIGTIREGISSQNSLFNPTSYFPKGGGPGFDLIYKAISSWVLDEDLEELAEALISSHLEAFLFIPLNAAPRKGGQARLFRDSGNGPKPIGETIGKQVPSLVTTDVLSNLASNFPEAFFYNLGSIKGEGEDSWSGLDLNKDELAEIELHAAKEIIHNDVERYYDLGLSSQYSKSLEPYAMFTYLESGLRGWRNQESTDFLTSLFTPRERGERAVNSEHWDERWWTRPTFDISKIGTFPANLKDILGDHASEILTEGLRYMRVDSRYMTRDYTGVKDPDGGIITKGLTVTQKVNSIPFYMFMKLLVMFEEAGQLQMFVDHPGIAEAAVEWVRYFPEAYLNSGGFPSFYRAFPELKDLALKNVVLANKRLPFAENNLNTEYTAFLASGEDSSEIMEEEAKQKVVYTLALEFPENFLHRSFEGGEDALVEAYPEYRHIAIKSLAEKNPDSFIDHHYGDEYPEFKGIAALNYPGNSLPEDSPIDYREIPIGQKIDEVDEEDYYEVTEWAEIDHSNGNVRDVSTAPWASGEGLDDDDDDDVGWEPVGWERKLAKLKSWLAKNSYKNEARMTNSIKEESSGQGSN